MKYRSTQPGHVLIFFLVIMAIGLFLAMTVLTFLGGVRQQAQHLHRSLAASHLADAGLDKGLQAFQSNPDYTGETFSLGGGTVQVTLAAGSTANEKILSSSATVGTVTRRYRVKLSTQPNGVAIAFRYALQAGSLGFSIGNNSRINGNVYSNQNVTGGNGSLITGDARAVGTVSGVTVNGQKLSNQPTEPLPSFDNDFWKAKAQAGGTINGNYTPASGSTIGPLYIVGDLTFGQSTTITLKGPIYATGKITFGNDAVAVVDSSLGSDGVMIIADGTVTFGNKLTVNRAPQGGYLLIISNSTSSTAISLGNSSSLVNAPIYAPAGGITIGNSAQAVAFAANQVTTGNGAIVTYDQGLANASFTTGPGGNWGIRRGSYQEY